jgi:hypothetical protein
VAQFGMGCSQKTTTISLLAPEQKSRRWWLVVLARAKKEAWSLD